MSFLSSFWNFVHLYLAGAESTVGPVVSDTKIASREKERFFQSHSADISVAVGGKAKETEVECAKEKWKGEKKKREKRSPFYLSGRKAKVCNSIRVKESRKRGGIILVERLWRASQVGHLQETPSKTLPLIWWSSKGLGCNLPLGSCFSRHGPEADLATSSSLWPGGNRFARS